MMLVLAGPSPEVILTLSLAMANLLATYNYISYKNYAHAQNVTEHYSLSPGEIKKKNEKFPSYQKW